MSGDLREYHLETLISMIAEAPIGLCCFDKNLHFIFINSWLAQINGISVEEHLGRSIREVIPHVAMGVEAQLRHVIKTGEAVIGGEVDAETPAHQGLIRSFQHHYYPIKSGADTDIEVACVVQDVTERKRAERALLEARDVLELRVEKRSRDLGRHEARLRLLLESTNAVPWEADANSWVFTYIGPQAVTLLGYPLERWLENNFWSDHIHPKDRDWALEYCQRSSKHSENFEFEYRMIAADGREVWLHDIVNVVMQDGAAIALRGFMIDISERKQNERALHDLSARLINAQEDERSRIARELHDDFNQRIALLAMNLERLRDEGQTSPSDFVSDVTSLLQLTNELASDIHSLSHQLHPSILEQLGLFAAVESFCAEISSQHDIRVDVVEHGVSLLLSNEHKLCLYRVVQEALKNVVKHANAKRALIEFSGDEGGLSLQISDDGTGFDPADTGTQHGLGLLSMRERLRLVNGTISFTRNEPTGTRIVVRVPVPD